MFSFLNMFAHVVGKKKLDSLQKYNNMSQCQLATVAHTLPVCVCVWVCVCVCVWVLALTPVCSALGYFCGAPTLRRRISVCLLSRLLSTETFCIVPETKM